MNDLIARLEEVDPKSAQLVKLRFFGGFSMKQIAEIQGVSVRTAHNLWDFGRSWLKKQMVAS